MKKSEYYLRMAQVDPAHAEEYLDAAKAFEEMEWYEQNLAAERNARAKHDDEVSDARKLVEEANKPTAQALLDWYVKPLATKTLGVLPMVAGGLMMGPGAAPMTALAGAGLLGADIYYGLGANAQAKADAWRLGQKQPDWQTPSNAQRLEGAAMLAVPAISKLAGPAYGAITGLGMGGGFAASKVNDVRQQMAAEGFIDPNASLVSQFADATGQAVAGPQIDAIGMPGSVLPSMIPDAQMGLHGVRDVTHMPSVINYARSKGHGGSFDALKRQLPTLEKIGLAPVDDKSGVLDVDPQFKKFFKSPSGKLSRRGHDVAAEAVPESKRDGVGYAEADPNGADYAVINEAKLAEMWENKHAIKINDDVSVDPRKFSNFEQFRDAVARHELDHLEGFIGEPPVESVKGEGRNPWDHSLPGRRMSTMDGQEFVFDDGGWSDRSSSFSTREPAKAPLAAKPKPANMVYGAPFGPAEAAKGAKPAKAPLSKVIKPRSPLAPEIDDGRVDANAPTPRVRREIASADIKMINSDKNVIKTVRMLLRGAITEDVAKARIFKVKPEWSGVPLDRLFESARASVAQKSGIGAKNPKAAAERMLQREAKPASGLGAKDPQAAADRLAQREVAQPITSGIGAKDPMSAAERLLGRENAKATADVSAPPRSHAKKAKDGYEVSSAGDKRFSAMTARLPDGRTIEEAYQLDVKGYRAKGGKTWRDGKGKPPANGKSHDQLYQEYKDLWRQWADANPKLMAELAEKTKGKTLTDKYANTQVSQARALAEIMNEREGLKTEAQAAKPEGIHEWFREQSGEAPKKPLQNVILPRPDGLYDHPDITPKRIEENALFREEVLANRDKARGVTPEMVAEQRERNAKNRDITWTRPKTATGDIETESKLSFEELADLKRRGELREDHLPKDAPSLMALKARLEKAVHRGAKPSPMTDPAFALDSQHSERSSGLGEPESLRSQIMNAIDDMSPETFSDVMTRSKIYVPYDVKQGIRFKKAWKGDWPNRTLDIVGAALREGEHIVLTTNIEHSPIYDKLTWNKKTRSVVHNDQFELVHDINTWLPASSKLRRASMDTVELVGSAADIPGVAESLARIAPIKVKRKPGQQFVKAKSNAERGRKLAKIEKKIQKLVAKAKTLGEFVDGMKKIRDEAGFPFDEKADRTSARAAEIAQERAHEIIDPMDGTMKENPKLIRRSRYVTEWSRRGMTMTEGEIGRAMRTAAPEFRKQLSDLDRDNYDLASGQSPSSTTDIASGRERFADAPIDWEKDRLDYLGKNKDVAKLQAELADRMEYMRVTESTPEEVGVFFNGESYELLEDRMPIEDIRAELNSSKIPEFTVSRKYIPEGGMDETSELYREAGIADTEAHDTSNTVDAFSLSLWKSVFSNTTDRKTASKVVESVSKEVGLGPKEVVLFKRLIGDKNASPSEKAESMIDFLMKRGPALVGRIKEGEGKERSWGATVFLKTLDIVSSIATTAMSMLSGREFMIHVLNKSTDAMDRLIPGAASKTFRWTFDQGADLPREEWGMMRHAWEAMKRYTDDPSMFTRTPITGKDGKVHVEYQASMVGIRNAVRNMIAEATLRSREVDEKVRDTNIIALRKKLDDNDRAVMDFGKYLQDRASIDTDSSLNKDQRAFLKAGAALYDHVMGFMKRIDPDWKPRENYVTQLLKDFDTDLIERTQKLSTAERHALGNAVKSKMGIGTSPSSFISTQMVKKHAGIVSEVEAYVAKVRKAILSDPRNGEKKESLDETIGQLIEYKLNQLFGTGDQSENPVMIGREGQGPSALFKRKIFGYGEMQETHADILISRLVQTAHKNYPYHDLYRAMSAFTNSDMVPSVLRDAINAAIPDGFGRIQRWSTAAIKNNFLSGLSGDVRKPTAFSQATDWLMGTTTSLNPHPNAAAAHYWSSVMYRNLLTRPEFWMINATDPIIKTSFDGNFREWASSVWRVYPAAFKEAAYELITGKQSKLLAEAYKHVRAKGNVASELSGAMQPSEKGAIFGSKIAKLGGVGLFAQKGWAKLSGFSEAQEHFNTAVIWLIEAEKLLQRHATNPDALVKQHGSLVQAAVNKAIPAGKWRNVAKEATLRAEQRQGVGSDFMGKSEVMENFTAAVGKNHPAMALAIFTRMFQNYPATIVAQLAKATDQGLSHVRARVDAGDTRSLSAILKRVHGKGGSDNALWRAVSPTALTMLAAVLSYQGGRAMLTGKLTSDDYKEKDRKHQFKGFWDKAANIVGESGRLATRDLSVGTRLIPASILQNTLMLFSDPKTGLSGLADLFIPGKFAVGSTVKKYQTLFGGKKND